MIGVPFERPGPRRRGICLIRASEARNASSALCQCHHHALSHGNHIHFRASFFINFLFLLSFFRSSADIASMPWCFDRSISCWSPRTQRLIPGRGTAGSRTVPELAQSSIRLDYPGILHLQSLVSLWIVVLEADLKLHLTHISEKDRCSQESLITVSRKFRFFSFVECSSSCWTFVRTPATVILDILSNVGSVLLWRTGELKLRRP